MEIHPKEFWAEAEARAEAAEAAAKARWEQVTSPLSNWKKRLLERGQWGKYEPFTSAFEKWVEAAAKARWEQVTSPNETGN